QEKLTADFPAELSYRQDLADSYNNRGNLLSEMGRPKDAEAAYRQVLAIREKLAGDFPGQALCRRLLAASYDNLGGILDGPEARAMYEEAHTRLEALVADFPDNAEYKNDLARTCANLGQVLRIDKEYRDAERLLRRALHLKKQLVVADAGAANHRFEMAN